MDYTLANYHAWASTWCLGRYMVLGQVHGAWAGTWCLGRYMVLGRVASAGRARRGRGSERSIITALVDFSW
jgi:hypothetical protein